MAMRTNGLSCARLLDAKQIGSASIDLRLGTEFMEVQTNEARSPGSVLLFTRRATLQCCVW